MVMDRRWLRLNVVGERVPRDLTEARRGGRNATPPSFHIGGWMGIGIGAVKWMRRLNGHALGGPHALQCAMECLGVERRLSTVHLTPKRAAKC